MPALDVIGLGALNVDRIYSVPRVVADGAQLIGEAVTDAGGCSANTVYALAKLGLRCGFVGAVGDDNDAEIVFASFAEVGVDSGHIARKRTATTGSVLAFADGEGNRAMYVRPGANFLFGPEDIDPPYLASARLILLSSFAGDIPLAVQEAVVEALAPSAMLALSVDALLAQAGVDSLATLLGRCTIVFANAHELREMTGRELPAAAEALLERGSRTAVVTFGSGTAYQPWMAAKAAAGRLAEELPIVCWLAGHEGRWALAAPPSHEGPIVDATGAGDAFAAGFLWSLLAGEPLLRCASLGHVAAGFCLEALGCRLGLPSRQALLARHAHLFPAEERPISGG